MDTASVLSELGDIFQDPQHPAHTPEPEKEKEREKEKPREREKKEKGSRRRVYPTQKNPVQPTYIQRKTTNPGKRSHQCQKRSVGCSGRGNGVLGENGSCFLCPACKGWCCDQCYDKWCRSLGFESCPLCDQEEKVLERREWFGEKPVEPKDKERNTTGNLTIASVPATTMAPTTTTTTTPTSVPAAVASRTQSSPVATRPAGVPVLKRSRAIIAADFDNLVAQMANYREFLSDCPECIHKDKRIKTLEDRLARIEAAFNNP